MTDPSSRGRKVFKKNIRRSSGVFSLRYVHLDWEIVWPTLTISMQIVHTTLTDDVVQRCGINAGVGCEILPWRGSLIMRSTHQLLAVELQNGWQNITISSTNGYKIQTHLSGDVTIMAAWIVYTVDYSRKVKAWVGPNARRGHAWAGPSPTIPNPQAAAVTTSPWQWPSTSFLLRHSHFPFRLRLACGWLCTPSSSCHEHDN